MKPLTFAIVADPHVGSPVSEFRTALELCNSRPLDFVVLLGDLVHRCTEENVEALVAGLKSLNKPFYLVIGNHEQAGLHGDFDVEKALQEALAGPWQESFAYSFEAGGWLFIAAGLDMSQSAYTNVYINNYKGYVDRTGKVSHLRGEKLDRFQSQLEQSGDRPTCVLIHIPLAPIAERVHRRGCYDQTRILEELQIRSLIRERDNVRAVCAGHQHFNQVDVFDGRLHCVTQNISGGEYGDTPALRLVQLSETRIEGWLFWTDRDREDPGALGSEAGDRSFVWDFPINRAL